MCEKKKREKKKLKKTTQKQPKQKAAQAIARDCKIVSILQNEFFSSAN